MCIGNNQDQPFLDADLGRVTGSFSGISNCYGASDDGTVMAPTVCGSDDGGLFSSPSGRCPSKACR